MKYFADVDLKDLWSNREKGADYFVLPMPSDTEILDLEKWLGVKLPASYVELMRMSQNGGLLKRNAFPLRDTDGNIIRYIKNSYINSIGRRPADERDPKRFPEHYALELFDDTPNLIKFGDDLDGYFDTFVLNYLKCGQDGVPSVAWIDRKVRRGRDGEPPAEDEDWRNINETYYWELTTIAPTFETYIKELVVAPKLPAFDFAWLKTPLKEATQKSFREIVKAYGQEDLNAFGLYIDDEGSMVADAANTKEYLENLVADCPKDREYYTYATNEWKYEGTDFALDLFEPICKELARHSVALGQESKVKKFRDKLLDSCVEVLAELKAEGFFAKEYASPILLNANISNDEISAAKAKRIRIILA